MIALQTLRSAHPDLKKVSGQPRQLPGFVTSVAETAQSRCYKYLQMYFSI